MKVLYSMGDLEGGTSVKLEEMGDRRHVFF
jgi:hypothetical protein